jgi:UDP-N-acetylmuramate dehydrogenase
LPLTEILLDVRESEPLAARTTLGIGGNARWLLHARTADEVGRAHQWSESAAVPLFVMGGGSNLVIADEGFDGLVVHVDVGGRTFTPDGADTVVTAGAGEPWDAIVSDCVGRGLAGLECLSGIPGTVGGTPIQNVGAYGQDVSGSIDRVTAYDRQTRAVVRLTGGDCGFAYRTSRFKGDDAGRFVILDVTYRVRPGSPTSTYPDIVDYLTRAGVSSPDVADVRNAVLAVRRRKGMVIDQSDPDTRSVGSFFMNPLVGQADHDRVAAVAGAAPPVFAADSGRLKLPAAWLIERAGFRRGDGDGKVGISTKHTLALINRGGATARDVLRFATQIKRGVLDRFGISLRPEPVFVGFGRDHDLDFLKS